MKFIDLFSGIGGFHQAAKALGWDCVFASEIDKYARLTYHANHGMMPAGDITQIDAQDIPDHDMLMAGFPCQPFSVAGKRRGFEDTRGTLFFEIARILKYKQPRMFLLENVKGLKSHNGGKTFATILDTLEELGYDVHWNILNTKDYGIPQNRERIFILGFKEPRNYTWPEKQPKTTLGEFFGGLWGKDIAHTVRSSGRRSGIDDKHNWDTYIYTDVRNGTNVIHSWDIKPTTDRQKYICQQILQNRRKSCYGQKDGNPLTLEQLKTIIPNLQSYEISELLLLGILTAKDNGYDFANAKQSAGIDGVYRVVSETGVYPTITATQSNDYVLTDKAVARLEKWKQNKKTSVWTGDQNSTHTSTIRSTYYKDCTKITLNDNSVLRKLTPRECAMLQGFPVDFILPVSNTQAYKQLGNAVSVNVVKAILEQI